MGETTKRGMLLKKKTRKATSLTSRPSTHAMHSSNSLNPLLPPGAAAGLPAAAPIIVITVLWAPSASIRTTVVLGSLFVSVSRFCRRAALAAAQRSNTDLTLQKRYIGLVVLKLLFRAFGSPNSPASERPTRCTRPGTWSQGLCEY